MQDTSIFAGQEINNAAQRYFVESDVIFGCQPASDFWTRTESVKYVRKFFVDDAFFMIDKFFLLNFLSFLSLPLSCARTVVCFSALLQCSFLINVPSVFN